MPRSRAGQPVVPTVLGVLATGLAVSLGWGVRGVFGHEAGAMAPGALAGLCLALLPGAGLRQRAAWLAGAGAAGFAFGGGETYGQTVWLTEWSGRAGTWAWGMLGLALKGGVWIGLGGLYLGMAAGCRRYSGGEIALLSLGLLLLGMLGVQLLNRPFAPPSLLPAVYFSNYVQPADPDNLPRPESWGGLWLAFLGLAAYLAWVKGDGYAVRLGAWGMVGGLVGFPGGQAINLWHAGPPARLSGLPVDWWKVVEMSFGLVAGLALGLGAWLNRGKRLEAPKTPSPTLLGGGLARLLLPVAGLAALAAMVTEALPSFLESIPFGIWLLPAVLAFASPLCSCVVGLWLPCTLDAGQLARTARAAMPGSGAWPAILWGVLAVTVLAATWRWGGCERRAPGSAAAASLAFVALSQAVLATAKMLVEGRWLDADVPHRLATLPGGLTGPGFLLLAAILCFWAWGAGRDSPGPCLSNGP